jgi:hypothetical protein
MDKKVIIIGIFLFTFIFVGMAGNPKEKVIKDVNINTQLVRSKEVSVLSNPEGVSENAAINDQTKGPADVTITPIVKLTWWEQYPHDIINILNGEDFFFDELQVETNMSDIQIKEFKSILNKERDLDMLARSMDYPIRNMKEKGISKEKKDVEEKRLKKLSNEASGMKEIKTEDIIKIFRGNEYKLKLFSNWMLIRGMLWRCEMAVFGGKAVSFEERYTRFEKKYEAEATNFNARLKEFNNIVLLELKDKLGLTNEQYLKIDEIVNKRNSNILKMKKDLFYHKQISENLERIKDEKKAETNEMLLILDTTQKARFNKLLKEGEL